MSEILMGGGSLRGFDAETLHGMFAFRHHVFLDKLGWDVATQDDLEFDLLDTMNPVDMLARRNRNQFDGCWRLMPTTDAYMLKDTFPQLLQGDPAPCDPHIWELSRLAVDAGEEAGAVQAPLNNIAMGRAASNGSQSAERPIHPAFSRNRKPPALAGGVFTYHAPMKRTG